MKYDLKSRVIIFNKRLFAKLKSIKLDLFNKNIVEQVIRSSTSIGANYLEANGSLTDKEFLHKIHICKKESQETAYWLELLIEINSIEDIDLRNLINECTELIKIFASIANTTKINMKKRANQQVI